MGKPRRTQIRSSSATAAIPDAAESLATATPPPASAEDPRGGLLPRRDFLVKGAATVAFLAAFQLGTSRALAQGAGFDPFSYGVASGDPLPDRVIIWTRVNPAANATPGSGLGASVRGLWEVALDPEFTRKVAFGRFATAAASDHTVKIDVTGLKAYTKYYYRFNALGVYSPVGRTLTAPAANSTPASVRFGLVSCSNFEAGYFAAYRELATRDDLDFILHVGDYIYEYGNGQYGPEGFAGVTRVHQPATELLTLADYRQRHACYKADADLRNLHLQQPFITTWDDHESANNSWKGGAENHTEGAEGLWAQRESAAFQAYYEWMPLRQPAPTGSAGELRPIYRRFAFGTLVDLFMLDLRQYRDLQPASPADAATINSPARTIMGAAQTQWLQTNLATSAAKWKLIGNSVQITPIIVIPSLLDAQTQGLLAQFFGIPVGTTGAVPLNVDSWDGYGASRLQLLGLIGGAVTGRPVTNCVFLTGDIHSSYACDIPANPTTYATTPASLATEFVCTSITSDNINEIVGQPERIPNGTGGYVANPATSGFVSLIRGFNAWVKDVNLDFHGFSVVDVSTTRTQVDNWVIRSDASDAFAADPRIDPNAYCAFRSAYQTSDLSQKVTPAAGELGARI